jgi:hypothetical protein
MYPDQLLGGLPIFYVDFVYNSIHYRIAQNAMDAKQDGTTYQYTDGLLQFYYNSILWRRQTLVAM